MSDRPADPQSRNCFPESVNSPPPCDYEMPASWYSERQWAVEISAPQRARVDRHVAIGAFLWTARLHLYPVASECREARGLTKASHQSGSPIPRGRAVRAHAPGRCRFRGWAC